MREDDEISAEGESLAENTHREALHPLDQFRAMHQLAGQGADVETIAATFMTTPAVVKQRLRLASVSPKLHDIYAEDGMTLEQLMAFSVSEEHARQEQVWEQLQSSYNKQPYMIRSKLTEQAVRATDKRVPARYGIRSIPTLILVGKRREFARQAGAMPKSTIVQWARAAVANGRCAVEGSSHAAISAGLASDRTIATSTPRPSMTQLKPPFPRCWRHFTLAFARTT